MMHKNTWSLQETSRLTRVNSCKPNTTDPSSPRLCFALFLKLPLVLEEPPSLQCDNHQKNRAYLRAREKKKLSVLTRACGRAAGSGDTWLRCRQRSGLPNTRLGRRSQSPLYAEPQPFLRSGKLTSLSKYIPAASFPPASSAPATHSHSFTAEAAE